MMELSEHKLPITFRRTRQGYIFSYLLSLFLIANIILPIIRPNIRYLFYILSALGVLILLRNEITIAVNRLEIDRHKVTQMKGLLSVHSNSVYYSNITDVLVHQSLLGRIFNYGTLHINTAGTHEYEIDFKKIKNPIRVRNFLEVVGKQYTASKAAVARG